MRRPDPGRADDARQGSEVPAEIRLGQLAADQAALRRVATLVAAGASPADVFGAVAAELGPLTGADGTFVSRTSGDGRLIVVAAYGRVEIETPVGFSTRLAPGMASVAALRTGRTARVTGERLTEGPLGEIVRKLGIRATVAAPIVVEGSRWGVTVAVTADEDFRPGTEERMAEFTELAAMAVANAQGEQKLRKLADTQAALRRLAMLVASGEPPEAVFAAVTREVLAYFGNGTARMVRYELDGTATLVANEGSTGPHVRVGKKWEGYPPAGLTATVLQTGRTARVEDYRDLPGGEPYVGEGLRSAIGVPVYVNGRLWGLIAVGSGEGPLPADTEQRISEFTELVATAVANAQSRAELIGSRARIVAASDDVRRRIERDLHDGAQQRLVSLALRLRSAAAITPRGAAREEIESTADGLMHVIDDLREIARGIHPAVLSRAGLRPALRALGRRCAIPVDMEVRIQGRLPETVEVAAYYVVSEMLTNAVKHARASLVLVTAEVEGGVLRLLVRDDGDGGADPVRGSGLTGLKDRVEALGGTFSVRSPPGRGTTVRCQLPVADEGTDTIVVPESPA